MESDFELQLKKLRDQVAVLTSNGAMLYDLYLRQQALIDGFVHRQEYELDAWRNLYALYAEESGVLNARKGKSKLVGHDPADGETAPTRRYFVDPSSLPDWRVNFYDPPKEPDEAT